MFTNNREANINIINIHYIINILNNSSFLQVYDSNENFLAVQPHIDIMASLLFVNINGIPVMYAAF